MKHLVYLSLSDHTRVTFFKEQAIILDLRKDKYYVLNEQLSQLLLKGLTKGLFFENNAYSLTSDNSDPISLNKFIQKLFSDNILNKENSLSLTPTYFVKEEEKSGLENIDWRLPTSGVTISLFDRKVLRCFLTLLKVRFYIKFLGFYSLIKMIKRKKPNDELLIQPSSKELKNLSDSLNKACLLFPRKIKCLEWAISFVLVSLSLKWHCNLVIGVQNFPFIAHAWVEHNGVVMFDDKLLTSHLSIILAEPFEKRIL